MMYISLQDIEEALLKSGYISNSKITQTLFVASVCDRPILIEGAPGVGKTSVAKALADGLGIPFIRIQMYEGLTVDQILYDYDYQRQLLTLEAIRPILEKEFSGMTSNEALKKILKEVDFYGEDFLINRPVLKSIKMKGPKILLFDEIDKAPEEIEYMLYEFLENNSISIPQYGEIVCSEEDKPFVFLTSNNYRELSGALKRRCNYLFIDPKTKEEIIEILIVKAKVEEKIAEGIARCLCLMQDANLKQTPSISEAIEFATFLNLTKNQDITKDFIINSLGILIKNRRDEDKITEIVSQNGEILWKM